MQAKIVFKAPLFHLREMLRQVTALSDLRLYSASRKDRAAEYAAMLPALRSAASSLAEATNKAEALAAIERLPMVLTTGIEKETLVAITRIIKAHN